MKYLLLAILTAAAAGYVIWRAWTIFKDPYSISTSLGG